MFFRKAKARVGNFINRIPQHLQATRNFITQAVGHVNKGHRLLTHVSQGINQNDVFPADVKKHSATIQGLADTGLQKLNQLHKGADRFAEHLGNFNPAV